MMVDCPSYMQYCNEISLPYYYPEYIADTFSPPPTEVDAVVIGAGPTGLMAALVLAINGFQNIVVLEKRERFDRLNFITIYPDAFPFLKSINLLDSLLERGEFIASHAFYTKQTKMINLVGEKTSEPIVRDAIEARVSYDRNIVPEYFLEYGVLMMRLADLQDILIRKLADLANVHLHFKMDGELVAANNHTKKYSVRVNNTHTLNPELIILADGVNSQNLKHLGVTSSIHQPDIIPTPEHWHIFHCEVENVAQSKLSYKFDYDQGHIRSVSYGLTSAKRNELGISYYYSGVLTDQQLLVNAHEIADLQKIKLTKILWYSKPIVVKYQLRSQAAVANVLLSGDIVGVGSPNAGLGSVLGISAYGWCLDQYLKMRAESSNDAQTFYNATAREYVKHWQRRSMNIWEDIAALGCVQPAIS